MGETRARFIECFSAIFPELGADEIGQASADSVEGWDSVASVPLFAMVEEEFGMDIDAEDVEAFISFGRILGYLERSEGPGGRTA